MLKKRSRLPRILIGSLTYEGKDYCLDDWMDMTKELEYPKSLYDVLVVDNSADENHMQRILDKGIMAEYYKPVEDGSNLTIANARNVLRDKFLEGDYDVFLSLEIDNFLEPHHLGEMVSGGVKDVLTWTYALGDFVGSSVPCVVMKDRALPRIRFFKPNFTEWMGFIGKEKIVNIRNLSQGKRAYGFGTGLGCTLIRRRVLENIKFRSRPFGNIDEISKKLLKESEDFKVSATKRKGSKKSYMTDDSLFYTDCHDIGYNVNIDVSKLIEHRRAPWYKDWSLIGEANEQNN